MQRLHVIVPLLCIHHQSFLMSTMLLEEKYRPDTLGDIAGNHRLISGFMAEVKGVNKDNARLKELWDSLDSLSEKQREKALREIARLKMHKIRPKIFTGDAGTGKTTTAIAIGKDIFHEAFGEMFKEFNASDARTLSFVREIIKQLTSTGTREFTFIIIFLDEIDGMEKIAQEALRRIIERSTSAVFILACNDLDKVIDALKSRCTVCRFLPVPVKEATVQERKICDLEGIEATDEVLEEIYLSRFGDLRNAIGRIGELAANGKTITMDMIEEQAIDNDVFDTFYSLSANGQIRKAYRHFLKSRIDAGISQDEFALKFARRMLNLKIDELVKSLVFIFIKENRIGNDSDIGVLALAGKIHATIEEVKMVQERIEMMKKLDENITMLLKNISILNENRDA